ncbi:hypothetical protein ABZ714_01180 [Streptomyces sp. NPDC006798]|uniref:hypothetical protein n=1 Tax=Streptomyces sp. NPDC006798 TaxID=3155462 RepID=UPI0033C53D58
MSDLILRTLARVLRIPALKPASRTAPPPPSPPPPDPWRAAWTSPTKEQAQAVLRAREEAARGRRRLYVLPPGTVLHLPPGLLRR